MTDPAGTGSEVVSGYTDLARRSTAPVAEGWFVAAMRCYNRPAPHTPGRSDDRAALTETSLPRVLG